MLMKLIDEVFGSTENLDSDKLAFLESCLTEERKVLTDRERTVVNERINDLTFREIGEKLGMKSAANVKTVYDRAIRKLRKACHTYEKSSDGSEILSNLLNGSYRSIVKILNRYDIYTINQLTSLLKENGSLDLIYRECYGSESDQKCLTANEARMIHLLDRLGFKIRQFITNDRLNYKLDELDCMNYKHIFRCHNFVNADSFVLSTTLTQTRYSTNTKLETGTIKLVLIDSTEAKLRVQYNFKSKLYILKIEIETGEVDGDFTYYSMKSDRCLATESDLSCFIHHLMSVALRK